ncbi:DUF11 domain-containing protein [Spirosoma taeanense]|uniref:DUF11 domain-containing protein n=1 Tax=Spirosoma taeanense TaxID=2735870 RepID=A0A6M5Y6M7_9BACT|nr:sialate O-acetylesterase [Spirosoma taeanense]QJW88861.1 DUF11 domain-containing protein [Spirosoma taeanense]
MNARRFLLPAMAWVSGGLWSWCMLIAIAAHAQLSVSFPVAQTVFQRNNTNPTPCTVAGLCPGATERVEARLTALLADGGPSTDWQTLDAQPVSGHFAGQFSATGGWYRLEVRAWQGSAILATTQVQPVGIGEVFAIAGQSNGQGVRDRDAANPADGRVICVPHFNLTDTLRLPLPGLSAPVSATGVVGPRGLTSWCWGRLGDRLAARLHVPVLFYNAAWSGTAVRNWRESITLDSTATAYGDYFRPGMPYGNLKRIVQDYVPLTGLRAILWHQGETEFYDTDPSAASYVTDLQAVISRSRQDADFNLPWVVARASMDNNLFFNYGMTHYDPVISAQNRVVQETPNVFYGPDTDVIQMPRTDGVHLSGEALIQTGDAWNDLLTDDFFLQTQPRLPGAVALTDLSLRMQTNTPTPSVNQPMGITLTIRNDGLQPATNVRLRCDLPQPLTFVTGSGVTHQRGLVLATLPSVAPGVPVSLTFTVQPGRAGIYQPVAEIVRADQLDTDSRPNTSFGDGQDDVARIRFRTRVTDTIRFEVPVSVNADPLPEVTSAQPPTEPDKADLSLQMSLNQGYGRVGQVVSVSVTVTNRGGRAVSTAQVGCLLPGNLTFLDSPTMSLSGNTVRGTAGDVDVGASATLFFRATITKQGSAILRAQIEASTGTDPDSTPDNGFNNGEDDTVQVTMRVRP